MKYLALLLVLTLGALSAQEAMQPADRLEQHVWLDQLVGEWTITAEASMEPGGDPMTWESTESVRSIGGLWVVAEGSGDNDGTPFTSLLTIGYDSRKGDFVGSWIDSMQTTLWTYVGELDEEQRALSLFAEGPSFADPSEPAKYRDRIEIVGPDHRRMVSSVLAEDGSWTTYMTANVRRAK